MSQHPTTFRLQTVLDLRDQSKKRSEDAFFLAQQTVQKEKKQLDTLELDLVRKVEFRQTRRLQYVESAQSGAANIASLKLHETHIKSLMEKEKLLKQTIEQQKQVLKNEEAHAQIKRDEMLVASRDFKSIDKVKMKFLDQIRRTVEQKEEDARDELSQARYVRQTS